MRTKLTARMRTAPLDIYNDSDTVESENNLGDGESYDMCDNDDNSNCQEHSSQPSGINCTM